MSGEFKPYLPGVLALIADNISVELAVRLAKQRGGREVYIAKNPAPGSSISKIVGQANAQKLYKLLGSGKMLVPAGNISGQTGRRQRIAMLLDQGLSHSRIAAEVDVHIRTVERVSAELRSPTEQRQSDLFL
ncbi:helix-turn-helix domain-containing protein [Pseudophaeobacter arcticus]|uniref:helix-turn-helix domain-containing protein n=1 Tax=Pseudophaeobacter arcticus TaxID=385492 RepID=UPI00041C3CE8|nr:helix-turn-helix domain-containing protein [Pseudophaeobacter arcticus]